MTALAHVDPGHGKVYRVPFASVREARSFLRGPYSKGSRVVLYTGKRIECYERDGSRVSMETVA